MLAQKYADIKNVRSAPKIIQVIARNFQFMRIKKEGKS
jgi:hypothetical protein